MMKSFLLVVHVLALTLPFLAAQVQNQDQPECCENDERLFNQKSVLYLPSHPVLNNYFPNVPTYYHNRAVMPVNNLYKCHPYYVQSYVLRPQAQIPQWAVLTNVQQPTMPHHPTRHLSFMAIPKDKIPEKASIPTTDPITTPEPTLVPATEPVVSPGDIPEASSESVSAPETATVPVTSLVA